MTSTSFAINTRQWNKWPIQMDPLGEVDLEDPDSVQTAIGSILSRLYRKGYDATLLESAMQDVLKAYLGDCPGLLHCNMLYRDLRDAHEMSPTTEHLLDGDTKCPVRSSQNRLVGQHALLCVLLALVHDIVSSRRDTENDSWGPD